MTESLRDLLAVGSRLTHEGQWWQVAELDGPHVVQAGAAGVRRVSAGHLLADPSTRLDEAPAGPAAGAGAELAGLDKAELAQLRERVAHVQEVRTGFRQRVGHREQAAARAHQPSRRPARPGRPGGPSPPASGLAPLPLRPSGTAPVNAEFLTPGCLLNARPTLTPPATTRAAGNEGGTPRAGRRGTPLVPLIYRNRVFEALFRVRSQIRCQRGKICRLLPEWNVPGVYLSCTCDIERHEALRVRVEVGDLRRRAVAAVR